MLSIFQLFGIKKCQKKCGISNVYDSFSFFCSSAPSDIFDSMRSGIVNRPPKKMFTIDEDEQLKELVSKNGLYNWEKIAAEMKTRSARQCKERYVYYLDPNVNKEPYSEEEDFKLVGLVKEKGKKWSYLTGLFTNRNQYSLKNRYAFLQRTINKLGADIPLQKLIKAIHEMPPPKPKARPYQPKTTNTYNKIIIYRQDRPRQIQKADSMEIIPIEPPKQIQKADPNEIIPIKPPKQIKFEATPELEDIPHELDVQPDISMSPDEVFRVFSDGDFDDFFK